MKMARPVFNWSPPKKYKRVFSSIRSSYKMNFKGG